MRRAFNDNSPQTDIAKYRTFLKSLAYINGEAIANRPETEAKLRKDFRAFLIDCNMPLAAKNFDALLAEKSGDKARRNDGTIGWYHEFIPVLMGLNLAVLGKKGGGFDLKDLDEYGGMEAFIISHLRHDSVEDHISDAAMKAEQEKYRDEIKIENPAYDLNKANIIIYHSLNNIDLMSQRRLFHEDGSKVIVNGKHAKEEVKIYTSRMVNAESPFSFMLKLKDIIQNSSTFLGANKFDSPEKRQAKCDGYEDMYGPRYGFTDTARAKWPAFSPAIHTLDCMMGFILYPHFRYMESVDLSYPDKTPSDHPVSSRFVHGATKLNLIPEGLNPIAISLKRMTASVDPAKDAAKFSRLENFMEKVIKRALERHANKFPYLFQPAPPLPEASIPAHVVH